MLAVALVVFFVLCRPQVVRRTLFWRENLKNMKTLRLEYYKKVFAKIISLKSL